MRKRSEGKYNSGGDRRQMYEAFISTLKEDAYVPTYAEYSTVVNSFNKKVVDAMVYEAYEYLLPHRLGNLRVKKYKPAIRLDEDGNLKKHRLIPNWEATNKLWAENKEAAKEKKVIFYTNRHTEGYSYKWYFTNYRSNCINKSYYYFVPTRGNKRKLAGALKSEDLNIDYYE
jgi:hypothetical protein